MESETIAAKRVQYNKNRRSLECWNRMVGIGLSEIKQKQDENVGECWRRSEKVGVSWMFRWYVTVFPLRAEPRGPCVFRVGIKVVDLCWFSLNKIFLSLLLVALI